MRTKRDCVCPKMKEIAFHTNSILILQYCFFFQIAHILANHWKGYVVLFTWTCFVYVFQLSVMEGTSCQEKRFSCFIGTNNVIDLTSLFLALR